MGNHQDTTTNNQAPREGQQPRNNNNNNNNNDNVDVTGVVLALGSSTSRNPSAPPSTGQTSVARGLPNVTPPRPHRGSPSPPSTGQVNVRRGGSPFVTPPRPYRGTSPSTGTPPRGSPSRRSPSGRGSPSTRRGFSPSGRGTPPSGIGSSSSGRRGLSPAPSSGAGQMNQLGGRTSGSINVEISLGSSVTLGSSTVPTGGSPGKRKADIVPPEGVNPVCSVCKRADFCSWKALFGHMRCHPDRQWRGCFPPPGFEEAAQQALQQGEGGSGQIFGFDLNEARPPDQEELVVEEQPAGKFDLNLPPADDKDDEDNGRGAC